MAISRFLKIGDETYLTKEQTVEYLVANKAKTVKISRDGLIYWTAKQYSPKFAVEPIFINRYGWLYARSEMEAI